MHDPLKGIEDLNIAIVGPGAIADWHAENVRSFGGAVDAIAGPNEEDALAFSSRHGVQHVYHDLDELLGERQPDVVVVASPTPFHAMHTIRSIEEGSHVLCEIPVATNLKDAERVSQLAHEHEQIVAVAHTLRFWRPHREVRRRVEGGELAISHLMIRSLQLRQTDHGWTGRRRDWTDDVLWHHGAHVVDAALWLLNDPPYEASGWIGPTWEHSRTEMDVSITIKSSSGSLASLVLSYHSRLAVSDYLIVAPDQTLQIVNGRLLHADGEPLLEGAADLPSEQRSSVTRQDRQFFESVLTNARPEILIEDVLPAMRVLQAIADTQETND